MAKTYQDRNLPNYQDKILKLTIEFKFKIPKSYSKPKREQALEGGILPRQDIDNLTKSVLDALNTVAYADDKTIKEIHAWKRYAEEDEIIIMIEEL